VYIKGCVAPQDSEGGKRGGGAMEDVAVKVDLVLRVGSVRGQECTRKRMRIDGSKGGRGGWVVFKFVE